MRGYSTQHSQNMTAIVLDHDLTSRRRLRGARGQHLRLKSSKIYHKINIYGWILEGIVKFEFKFAYNLCVVVQQRTLFILRIFQLCCLSLKLVEWIRGVNQLGLLNLLWVPHYHCSNINTTCISKLLTLVRDGCLWLGAPISITNMLIHRIMLLIHEGLNLAKDFGENTSECDLVEKMKKKFELIKKLCGYSITSIIDPAV